MTEEFGDWIDWSKVDLLDACYDPAIGGMGLGSRGHALVQSGLGSKQPSPTPPLAELNVVQDCNSSTAFEPFGNAQNEVETLDHGYDLSPITPAKQSSSAFSDGHLSGESRADTMTRPVSPCRECGQSFDWNGDQWDEYWEKDSHARLSNHGAYTCQVTGCDRVFIIKIERDAHERTPHIPGHGRVSTSHPNDCVECQETLSSKANLLRHGKETQHQPYGCECGALFSRLDVLSRHLESFSSDDPKHPCQYCKLHRGPNGFRRLDHLMQHIRNYHHLEMEDETTMTKSRLKYVFPVCSHPNCPQCREEAFKQLPRKTQAETKPFHSQSAYTKHMRDEHNECTFPCDVLGCSRVGRRGYFREKDLLNHRRQEHPDAPTYRVTKRELRLRCTEPGCDTLLDPSSMYYHLDSHGQARN